MQQAHWTDSLIKQKIFEKQIASSILLEKFRKVLVREEQLCTNGLKRAELRGPSENTNIPMFEDPI